MARRLTALAIGLLRSQRQLPPRRNGETIFSSAPVRSF